jgi:hypothetical protein
MLYKSPFESLILLITIFLNAKIMHKIMKFISKKLQEKNVSFFATTCSLGNGLQGKWFFYSIICIFIYIH